MPARLGIWADVVVNNPTGIGRVARGLIRAWRKLYPGTELVLFVGTEVSAESARGLVESMPGIVVERLPVSRKRLYVSWGTLGRLSLGQMGRRCDAYFSPLNKALGNSDVPVVSLHHDLGAQLVKGSTSLLTRLQYRLEMRRMLRLAAVVAVSGYSRDALAAWAGCDRDDIVVAQNGLDESWFRPVIPAHINAARRAYGLNGPYFVHVGAMVKRKNIPFLVRAFERAFHGKGPDLVLVGPSEKPRRHGGAWAGDDVQQAISALKLETKVRVPGYMSEETLRSLVAGADALLFPSLYEGFGLPAVEAMAVGTPVVASKVTSLPEVVADAGILLDPSDLESWADAMQKALDGNLKSTDMVARGRTRARLFTFDRMAQTIAEVYRTRFGIAL